MASYITDPGIIPTNVRYYVKFLTFRARRAAQTAGGAATSQARSQRVVIPAQVPATTQSKTQRPSFKSPAATPTPVPSTAQEKKGASGVVTIEQLQCALTASAAGIVWTSQGSTGVCWVVESDSKSPFSVSQSVELRQPLAICKYFSESKSIEIPVMVANMLMVRCFHSTLFLESLFSSKIVHAGKNALINPATLSLETLTAVDLLVDSVESELAPQV